MKVQIHDTILTINEPVDYMARAIMSLMRRKDITQAIGRVGLKVELVLGTEIAQATASVIWAQKRRDYQPNHSNGPSDVFALHQNHNGQAPYKKTGSLVILCK